MWRLWHQRYCMKKGFLNFLILLVGMLSQFAVEKIHSATILRVI